MPFCSITLLSPYTLAFRALAASACLQAAGTASCGTLLHSSTPGAIFNADKEHSCDRNPIESSSSSLQATMAATASAPSRSCGRLPERATRMVPLSPMHVLLYASTTVAVTEKYMPATTMVGGQEAALQHGQRELCASIEGTGLRYSFSAVLARTAKALDVTLRILSEITVKKRRRYPEQEVSTITPGILAIPDTARLK